MTTPQELLDAGTAGLLHDVGKTRVANEILNKHGPLTDDEWREIKRHPAAGFEIVKDNPNVSERAKRVILEHHEDKWGPATRAASPASRRTSCCRRSSA